MKCSIKQMCLRDVCLRPALFLVIHTIELLIRRTLQLLKIYSIHASHRLLLLIDYDLRNCLQCLDTRIHELDPPIRFYHPTAYHFDVCSNFICFCCMLVCEPSIWMYCQMPCFLLLPCHTLPLQMYHFLVYKLLCLVECELNMESESDINVDVFGIRSTWQHELLLKSNVFDSKLLTRELEQRIVIQDPP